MEFRKLKKAAIAALVFGVASNATSTGTTANNVILGQTNYVAGDKNLVQGNLN